MAVFGDKKVTAMHGAAGRMQATAAGVLKRLPRSQQGLLTHHAQAFDFLGVPAFVLNDPVPGNQLSCHQARVGDRDGVGKSEHLLKGIALVCQVLGLHINLDGVRRHLCMLTATIQA